MVEETFDVVNVDDEVIGQARRREVHEKGLLHRAVHIFVFDCDGRLLIQRRGFAKDCAPGLWDTSAGGHVDSGEDYDVAAVRELQEELGITSDTPLAFQFKVAAGDTTGHEFVCVYRATSDDVPILQASEIEAARWVNQAELTAWVARRPHEFTPVFLTICRQIGFLNSKK